MPTANIRASWYGGEATEPLVGSDASTGVSLDRSDIQTGTEPLPVPTTGPRTSYSAIKQIALEVLDPLPSPPTTLVNGTVRAAASMPTGAAWMFSSSPTYIPQLSLTSSLAAGATGGDVTLVASFAYAINAFVQIDEGATAELRQVLAVTGTGPYTLTVDRILAFNHSIGAQIAQFNTAGPADVPSETGGQPFVPPSYALPLTTPTQFSPLGLSVLNKGRIGPFVVVIGAISTAYGTTPGTAAVPNLIVSYDEF